MCSCYLGVSGYSVIFVIQVFSLIANIGCSIGKLFPGGAKYICNTWQCMRLVHNAVMTLTSGAVDLVERFVFLYVLVSDGNKLCGCVPFGGQHRLLQKVAQLCISLAWTIRDTLEAAVAAPGTGTLVLAAFACAIQVILLRLDARAAWLTERLNQKADHQHSGAHAGVDVAAQPVHQVQAGA